MESLLSALIGDFFEIAVKRGVLGYLCDQKLVPPDHPELVPFREQHVQQLYDHVIRQLDVVDTHYISQLRSLGEHLLLAGYGLGWSCIRAYLQRQQARKGRPPRLEGIFCPLTLRERGRSSIELDQDQFEKDQAEATAHLWSAFNLAPPLDRACSNKGGPGRADFLLLLSDETGRLDLLCLEFSLNVPVELASFTEEAAHLGAVEQFVRLVDGRGVFSHISAEVAGEGFVLSEGLLSHLQVFTSRDKPLYKLCQGSSYASQFVRLLRNNRGAGSAIHAQVLAITAAGVEGISGTFHASGEMGTSAQLMVALGTAYRRAPHAREGDNAAFDRELRAVYAHIERSLPPSLRLGLQRVLTEPPVGEALEARLSEQVTDFLNPNQELPRARCLHWITDDSAVSEMLGGSARDVIDKTLADLGHSDDNINLRTLHEAAIVAALRSAPKGKLRVLGLEGHPGIGKTTAVMRALDRLQGGYLLFYVSPRIVINADVTTKLAYRDDRRTGVLTLTTNSRLIGGAASWYQEQVAQGLRPPRTVDGAVVAEGVEGFVEPTGSTLFLSNQDARDVDQNFAGARLRKLEVNEREALVRTERPPGVLRTIARAARAALQANPNIQRTVLTAAIQGYRELGDSRTTLEALGSLFAHGPDTPRGRDERAAFAQRSGVLLFMVDELAGDNSGAPLVQAVASWLHEQFIEPFIDNGGSPFTIVLLIADASLGNEMVLARYLENQRAPDKVLVSRSEGPRPFRLAAKPLRIGRMQLPTLHVMADSFPATTLTVDYSLRFLPIDPANGPDGTPQSQREIIRAQVGELLLDVALQEIRRAVLSTPEQVIFFAQDKGFLNDLEGRLAEDEVLRTHGLTKGQIGVLHSSIYDRSHVIRPEIRDSKKIFLMTSSGARGVSFPRATHIIAVIPRFSVETGLMEIAQLIYRGRGFYRDPKTGAMRSGDDHKRHLVLMINDFILRQPAAEPAQESRRWVRQTLDLLTLLVLLRATMLTRIRGDAGVPGQQLAVVPVGSIGTDDLEQTMSEHVREFLREADVFLRGRPERERAAIVAAAQKNTREIFPAVDVLGRTATLHRRSISQEDTVRALAQQIYAATTPLLRPDAPPRLPPQVTCIGPLWLEDWSDLRTEESFIFEIWDHRVRDAYRHLLGQLNVIKDDRSLPSAIRWPARTLHKLLIRERQDLDRQYKARKPLRSVGTWLCVPLDYPRFCTQPDRNGSLERRPLNEPIAWHSALLRAAQTTAEPTVLLPVLPHYDSKPFVLMRARWDPTDMERVLDDRYFMASTELNLLNTILFASNE